MRERSPRSRGRGRRPALPERPDQRRELIVRAALDLLDEEGFDGVSLRRLASHLGMHAPGLYWYIENKQDLIDLMAKEILDRGLAGIKPPRPGVEWQEWMVELACAVRSALMARRDGARVAGSAFLLKTGGLTHALEIALELLEGQGFERLVALGATMTMVRFAIGAALGEQVSPMSGIKDQAELDRLKRMVVASLDAEQWPRTAAAYQELFDADKGEKMGIRNRERIFRWGAEMFVRGLATYPGFPAEQQQVRGER
jgi:TetR/AcrR family tetracycline transcriptional repressor